MSTFAPRDIGGRDWAAELPWNGGRWADRSAFEELSYRSIFEHLIVVRRAGDLRPNDFPLICVLRNESALLPIFFDHYKKLGVTRFIMIDNNSEDNSREILLAEKTADVFFTRQGFLSSQSGLYWANGLAHALCQNRWLLRVDADELLIYEGMETHDLADLAQWLEKRGRDRLFAPMRDMYSSSPFDDERHIAEILETDCWFDDDGYKFEKWKEGWQVLGGPRQRLFGQDHVIWLSKFPFFRMTARITVVHHHYLWPLDQTRHEPVAALLHLKMLGNLAQRSKRYVIEQQHWNRSKAYGMIDETLRERPGMTAFHASSRRYEGPRSFIRHGLMQSIDWEDKNG